MSVSPIAGGAGYDYGYFEPSSRGTAGVGSSNEVKQDLRGCKTCAERKYKDGSNDPSVSFQTAQHVSPQSAPRVVAAHEQEHVRNERVRAAEQGREVIYQSVTIHTSVCPECGRTYVSGGKTTTVTASGDSNPAEQNPANSESSGRYLDVFA